MDIRKAVGTIVAVSLAVLVPRVQNDRPKLHVWVENGPREECVDVLFVGDGYTRKHMGRAGKYLKDVDRCAKRLLEEIPFSWYAKRFNVRALMLESAEAGCDQAQDANEVDTVLDACFDTAEGRLLVFRSEDALAELVQGAGGADLVFVMVNTERYGGGGTTLPSGETGTRLPAPTFSAQDTRSFLIAIHELGHSFAGLADEYADEDMHERFPLPDGDGGDLGAANVSRRGRFDDTDDASLARTLKWSHFLGLPGADRYTWLHEGGFFRERDVFRPFARCRMRSNEEPFCPVCCEEVAKAILATCGLEWDDAAYHAAHPLDRRTWSRRR